MTVLQNAPKKEEVRVPVGDGLDRLSSRSRTSSLLIVVASIVVLFLAAWFLVRIATDGFSKGGVGAPVTPSVEQ